MAFNRTRVFLVAALLPLAGCISAVPLHVGRAGTLPAERYAQFDVAAAKLSKVTVADAGGSPEPKWVYVFDAPFDPHAAPLQIGRFVGRGETPERVAGNLPGQLVRVLGESGLFPQVTLDPTAHAYLLSGTVTRAEGQQGLTDGPGTQVEATVSRDGRVMGAIQVNAMQIGIMPMSPFMLLASAVASAGQGTRASFVSERFADVFRSVATGVRSAAWSGGTSGRYMEASPGAD